jgi:hypothetical protein
MRCFSAVNSASASRYRGPDVGIQPKEIAGVELLLDPQQPGTIGTKVVVDGVLIRIRQIGIKSLREVTEAVPGSMNLSTFPVILSCVLPLGTEL